MTNLYQRKLEKVSIIMKNADVRPQLDDVYGYLKPEEWNIKELGTIERIDLFEFTIPATNPGNNGRTIPLVDAYRYLFDDEDDLTYTFGNRRGRGCPSARKSPQDKVKFGPLFPGTTKDIKKMVSVIRKILILGHNLTEKEAKNAKIMIKKMVVIRNGYKLVFGYKQEKEKVDGKKSIVNKLYLSSVNGKSTKHMSLAEAQGYVEGIANATCEFKKEIIRSVLVKKRVVCAYSGKLVRVLED